MLTKDQRELLKAALLFSGVFVFGLLVAVALHEFGHALAIGMTGGTIRRIVLHPFSVSSVTYDSLYGEYRIWHAWGGVGFSCLAGLMIVGTTLSLRLMRHLPFSMAGMITLAANGFYLTVGGLFPMMGGDPARLIQLGVPKTGIIILGLFLFLLSACLFLYFLPMFGVRRQDSISRRLLIFGGGTSPYLMGVLVYNFFMKSPHMAQYIFCIVLMSLFLVGAVYISKWVTLGSCCLARVIAWRDVYAAGLLGSSLLVGELLFI